ncbi:MAG: 1,6-anhydro-N-acetylmuramyl-L-alanine amidase AmpD [Gammaproteobacteria bacterium]
MIIKKIINHESWTLDLKTGLVGGAIYEASPNFNGRPDPINSAINLIVIHNISLPPEDFDPRYNYVRDLFLNQLNHEEHIYFETLRGLEVSSHFYIRRNGALWQFVPTHLRAWHAGKSLFEGRKNCNDFSLGIELEGADMIPYSEEQYVRLCDLLKLLMLAYPQIEVNRIVGHSDIASDRKTDPGESFDWIRVRKNLIN